MAKTPTAILTTDWHLRDTKPVCRIDDYMMAQGRKLHFLWDLVQKYSIPILFAGDFFDRSKVSEYLKIWVMKNFDQFNDKNLFVVAGNHDLPNHNLDLLYKSSLGLMDSIDFLRVIKETRYPDIYFQHFIHPFHWDQKIENSCLIRAETKNVALTHYLTYKRRKPWPGIETKSAIELLKKFDKYDLIVTGDNHKSFSAEYEGRILVNPGSMMRMDADQIDHKPRVALWYAEDNSIEWAYFPIEEDVISREHIEKKEARDERMEAFISRLNTDYEIDLSFEKNLEAYFSKNRTRKAIKEIVWEIHDESKSL